LKLSAYYIPKEITLSAGMDW